MMSGSGKEGRMERGKNEMKAERERERGGGRKRKKGWGERKKL